MKKKIDFRKIEVVDLEGKPQAYDLSKELGNAIYFDTADIAELDLARSIYQGGEVELDAAQAEVVHRYVEKGWKAFIKAALLPQLDAIINPIKK